MAETRHYCLLQTPICESHNALYILLELMISQIMSTEKPRDASYAKVVKEAIDLFRTNERAYLLTYKSPKSEYADRPGWYYAAHMSYYAEVLFVLKGVKPCVLFASGDQSHTQTIIDTCLKPLIEQFDLLSYGFRLQQITHPLPTTAHAGFQNGWVLADTHSDKWDTVQQVLLRPYPNPPVPEALIGDALGYPSRKGPCAVSYIDETERQYLRKHVNNDVCCVDSLEFFCVTGGSAEYMAILRHFIRYKEAMQEVGRTATLDTARHPALAQWLTLMRMHLGIA